MNKGFVCVVGHMIVLGFVFGNMIVFGSIFNNMLFGCKALTADPRSTNSCKRVVANNKSSRVVSCERDHFYLDKGIKLFIRIH